MVVGSLRLEVPYGSAVQVDGRRVVLAAPGDGAARSDAQSGPVSARLREWRSATAKAEKVPAYVILNDRDLEGIAARRPTTLAELARCRGMGPVRLERHGDEILTVVEAATADA
jgi:superfamily II DNA helicase RecQ